MTFPALFSLAWTGERPPPDTPPGPCELCGHHAERVAWKPRSSWGAHETHAVPGEGAICEGCHLLTVGRSPFPSKSGSRMLAWTLFTLATDGNTWRALTAAEKPEIGELLRAPGWAVAVTTTGKRNVAHTTPAGTPGNRGVSLDGQPVGADRRGLAVLLEAVERAYRDGATKSSLERGELSHADARRVGFDRAREINQMLAPHKHTRALRLAVWTATKEEPS